MPHRYRAGAIGHTGQGNFGHQLDLAYQTFSNVDFVAVADPDPEGREAATQRTGAQRSYADYRELLAKESLDLVSIRKFESIHLLCWGSFQTLNLRIGSKSDRSKSACI